MAKNNIKWAEPEIGSDEVEAVKEAVKSTWIGGNGPRVVEFEEELCRATGAKYALALSNGTAALTCAMQALRQKGFKMRFAVPTLTFFATGSTAYELQGGMPQLVDCDKSTWNILVDRKKYAGAPIVVPVDVGGLPVDYDGLRKEAGVILADSAEAMGSKYKGEPVGHQAEVHCFSFHSAKVVTTGEGGAVTTNDNGLYELMKSIANQGYGKKEWYEYKHENLGFNYRMSELHAALGIVQFRKLDKYVRERNEKARIYKDILGENVGYQNVPKHTVNNYFLFVILVDKPIKLCEDLAKEGIGCKTMWIPLHKQPPFKTPISLPNAEYVADHGVMLPIHNMLSMEQTKLVADTVKRLLK